VALPIVPGWVRINRTYAQRLRIAAAAKPARVPPLAVTDPDLVDEAWVNLHRGGLDGPAFDLAFTGPLALTLSAHGLIWQDEHLMTGPEILPGYVVEALRTAPAHYLTAPRALPRRHESRPAYVFLGWGIQVFGHFLIEMLPKLLLAQAHSPSLHGAMPVLDRAMPDWFLTILGTEFGITEERAIWFDSRQEQLTLDQAILIPNLLRPGGYHPHTAPLFNAFTNRLTDHRDGETGRAKIFIARGTYRNPASVPRVLLNEPEIARIAEAEFGCTVLHPETLAFAEQVRRISNADLILGQAGSAMHLALVAPAQARIGVLRFMAPDQSFIAALRGQSIAYLTQGIAETAPAQFIADPERFRRFVHALMAD
jgi:capsular polysaccharide biosynthesis protein